MFSWLKKHFIPHDGNDHRPHFLRDETMAVVVSIVLVAELLVFVLPVALQLNVRLSGSAAVLPAVLSDLTNTERETNGVTALKDSPLLDQAATLKAEDMASKGYFAHTSPDGKTPWYWLDQVGYKYDYAGENLAIDFADSADVTDAWMNSPAHRANIVKADYTEEGTGVASGMYEGHETVYVVQEYASPRAAAAPAVSEVAKPAAPEPAVADANVLGASVAPAQSAPAPAMPAAETPATAVVTAVNTAVTSPRHAMNLVLFVALFLAVAVSGLTLFKDKYAEHSRLVRNGLALVALVACLYLVNGFASRKTVALAPGSAPAEISYEYSAAVLLSR